MAARKINRGNIGEIIREARLKQDFTQKTLGDLLGYKMVDSGAIIRKWEAGVSLPPLDKIRKISQILDVPLDDLIP